MDLCACCDLFICHIMLFLDSDQHFMYILTQIHIEGCMCTGKQQNKKKKKKEYMK